MMFIVSQLMSKKEKEELSDIFMALDKNGDGSLTSEELLEGYTKLYGNVERARAEVKYIMSNADIDNNGTIDYSGTAIMYNNHVEFLLASANKKQLLSKSNVKQAFDMFDIVRGTHNETLNRTRAGLYPQTRSRRSWAWANGSLKKPGRRSSLR